MNFLDASRIAGNSGISGQDLQERKEEEWGKITDAAPTGDGR